MPKMEYFETEKDMWEKVAKLFDKTEKSVEADAANLQEWMRTQKHLPEVTSNINILKNFVILNKGSVEVSKQKIDMYYTVRSLLSHVYEKSNPKSANMKEIMAAVYYLTLPKLTSEMYRVFWFKVRDPTMIDHVSPLDVIRTISNIAELRLNEDVMHGGIFVIDCKDVSLKFVMKITPMMIYNVMVTIYEKVYSSRLKAIYIINAPPFIERIIAILRSVMKPKLFSRICINQGSDLPEEKLPKRLIPSDYGGNEKSLEEIQEMLEAKFQEYEERFDKLDVLRVDENLRPAKLKDDDILGVHGNFKKLELD